jgi:hypothetical protein
MKSLAAKYNLKIRMLQPFSNFEGWEKGSKEREDALNERKGGLELCVLLGRVCYR